MSRIFAIGDIHGCFDRLDTLLKRLPYREDEDTLVFIGDLINRGKDSRSVVERVYQLSLKGQVIVLMGNHEQLLLEYESNLDTRLVPYLRELGVESTLESYGQNTMSRIKDLAFMPSEHRELMRSLRLYWETDSYVFVHGGIVPNLALADQSNIELTGMRDFHEVDEARLEKTVIFGHTPFQTPFVSEKKIGIDTGAVYDNMLTAVQLPERIFYHA